MDGQTSYGVSTKSSVHSVSLPTLTYLEPMEEEKPLVDMTVGQLKVL